MKGEGYRNSDAGCISLVATDATKNSMVLHRGCHPRRHDHPENPHLINFIRRRGFKAKRFKQNTPLWGVTWLVEELNKTNNLGAATTVLQRIHACSRLLKSYDKCVQAMTDEGREDEIVDIWTYVKGRVDPS